MRCFPRSLARLAPALLLATLFVPACEQPMPPGTSSAYEELPVVATALSEDEAAVYRAVLRFEDTPPPFVVSRELTHLPSGPIRNVDDDLRELSAEAALDLFARLERSSRRALPRDALGYDTLIVPWSRIEMLSRRPGRGCLPDLWAEFKTCGFTTFTPVGFDSTGTIGVLYSVCVCGPLCATASVWRVERDSLGVWSVSRRAIAWVS